jgi:hypothetical protein
MDTAARQEKPAPKRPSALRKVKKTIIEVILERLVPGNAPRLAAEVVPPCGKEMPTRGLQIRAATLGFADTY